MKINKDNFLSILCGFIMLLFLNSCTTADEFKEPNNTSGRVFSINELDLGLQNQENDLAGIELGADGRAVIEGRVNSDPTFFRNLSFGANGITWIFPEGAVDILGSTNDITSNENEINVVFLRAGQLEVQLKGDFSGPVSSDTEITPITILEEIIADFTSAPAIIDNRITIATGEDAILTSTSLGQPKTLTWEAARVISVGADGIPVLGAFNDLGGSVFNLREVGFYVVRLIAQTDMPFGFSIKDIGVEVTVPSTNPVFISAVEEESGDLILEANRFLNPLPTDAINSFQLVSNGIPIGIQSISLDPDNTTQIRIVPQSNIVFLDETRLSYRAGGIEDTFGLPVDDLVDLEVVPFADNILEGSLLDFENNGLDDLETLSGPGRLQFFDVNFALSDGAILIVNPDDIRPGAPQGSRSLELTQNVAKNSLAFQNGGSAVGVTPGSYVLRFWAKSTSATPITFFSAAFSNLFSTTISNPDWMLFQSDPFNLTNNADLNIRIDNANSSGYTLRIDDLEIIRADQ